MGNEFLRSNYLRFLCHHQALEVNVAGDKEVAFIGAAEDKNVVRVRHAIPHSSYPWEQRFSFGEIHRQHSQMISNELELRTARGIYREKQFLKHNRVNGEANTASCLGSKQLCRRWITPEVFNDHVCVEEHEWLVCVGALTVFDLIGLGQLFHFFIVIHEVFESECQRAS